MSDNWSQDLYEQLFVGDRTKLKKVMPPEGCVECPRCHGTGVGQPGETYSEMGTSTYGCSECHSFGYVSKR